MTLLLLGTIAGLSLAVWKLGSQVRPMKQELKRLRNEVGQLHIEDPTKIHVIAVETYEDDVHKFRIYVPDAPSYHLRHAAFNLPKEGIPELPAMKRPDYPLESGQYLVTVRLERRFDRKTGEPIKSINMDMKIESAAGHDFSSTTSANIGISEANNDWIVSGETGTPKFVMRKIGREVEVIDSDEPAVLLRIRAGEITRLNKDKEGRPTSWSVGQLEEPCDGFMLWIEQWQKPEESRD